ncbi:transcriptional regulatory protein [Reinekea sp. MED297]|uniref:Transcriptional regulatory protein n=2 Tax=Reinekea TaxID=230494 RepID=A4BGX8_9GAMM|nr:transcriptional regulatory protein [Reinekea sp. MED297] [Reinekea blandensis MED297]
MIRRLHQISSQVFQHRLAAAGLELTPVQFATLTILDTHPVLEQAQIAALIAYDRATIGGVIDRLEQRGYVTRKTSVRDRRARDVSLSDAGLKALRQAEPIVTDLQSEILKNLTQSEQRDLIALLTKAVKDTDHDA